jgi:glycosyltransferase involved in cell wall biosynthesis
MVGGISVVIPTYNNRQVLPDTIRPLLEDPATSEIVVVVDGSEDGSYEYLQQLAHDDPRLRPFLIPNRGRPGALQHGVAQATNEIVLLMDADVVASDGLVSGHAAWHETTQPRLVLGYMPVDQSRRETSYIADVYAKSYEEHCEKYERDPRQAFVNLWTGNLSMPRRFIESVGGIDGGLGLRYHGDLEFGLRLGQTELEPIFDRRLLADHRYERSFAGHLNDIKDGSFDMVVLGRGPGAEKAPRWKKTIRRVAIEPRLIALTIKLGLLAMDGLKRLGATGLEKRVRDLLAMLSWQLGVREAHERQAQTPVKSSA